MSLMYVPTKQLPVKNINMSTTPKSFLKPFGIHPFSILYHLSPRQPLICFLSLWIDWFVFSRILYSWSQIVGIFYLASFTQIIILKFIHVDVSINSLFFIAE